MKRAEIYNPFLPLGLVVVALAGGLVLLSATPALWHGSLAVVVARHARESLKTQDYDRAQFWSRRWFQLTPQSAEAATFQADLTAPDLDVQTLFWRSRAAQLEPENATYWLSWAQTALEVGQYSAVGKILQRAPEKARKSDEGIALLGLVALQTGNWRDAETLLRQASERDPSQVKWQIELANVRLLSSDAVKRDAALKFLEAQANEPEGRVLVFRALRNEAQRQKQLPRFLDLAEQTCAQKESVFLDRLARLEAATQTSSPKMDEWFRASKEEAAFDPVRISQLLGWLGSHQRSEEALAWVDGLDRRVRWRERVQCAVADLLITVGNWTELEKRLTPMHWPTMEPVRLALLSMAQRQQGSLQGDNTWQLCLEMARETHSGTLLLSLASLTEQWKWESETVELWWEVGRSHDAAAGQALEKLFGYYYGKKDSRKLLEIARLQRNTQPESFEFKNNSAYLSLLLRDGEESALNLAKEVYKAYPRHPVSAATYALACYRMDNPTEGLRALYQVTANEDTVSGFPLIQAVLASKLGNRAVTELALSQVKVDLLLPEETKLMEEARARVQGK
jgi:predicted Zn-dependent protease